MKLESKIGVAKSNVNSLRTTIPQGIVVFLELEPKQKLSWSMEFTPNGERYLVVKKA